MYEEHKSETNFPAGPEYWMRDVLVVRLPGPPPALRRLVDEQQILAHRCATPMDRFVLPKGAARCDFPAFFGGDKLRYLPAGGFERRHKWCENVKYSRTNSF